MADGDGNNSGAASTETGTTTVVGSPQQAMMPKKPKKRKKKSESSDEQSTGGANVSGCAAPEGDGGKEKQETVDKKDRLVWTPKLHGKFVRACNELGIKDAVPMKILRRMKISGVTRAQVASHLQKYRGNLSKQKDEETSGNDATTMMVVHHCTPIDSASPSPPATAAAPLPAIPASVPPSPRSPLETTPDTMCQPPNAHSSDHAAANLYHQQLQLLLLPPVQHQHCFPPPPLLHQVGAVTITGEQTPSMMQQQATAAAASQHGPTLAVVEQATGTPVPPASGVENGRRPAEPHVVQPSQAVDMLRAFPKADMRLEEPEETRMAQALVDAEGEKVQRRASEQAAAFAWSLSPPGSIIERFWGSGDRPSWDLFGLRPISTDRCCYADGDFHAKD